MNLAEEMQHVEEMDKKFLQKIFDRIDVDKKGAEQLHSARYIALLCLARLLNVLKMI